MICHFRCCPHFFIYNTCRTSDGSASACLEQGWVYRMMGRSDPACCVTVGVMFRFACFLTKRFECFPDSFNFIIPHWCCRRPGLKCTSVFSSVYHRVPAPSLDSWPEKALSCKQCSICPGVTLNLSVVLGRVRLAHVERSAGKRNGLHCEGGTLNVGWLC